MAPRTGRFFPRYTTKPEKGHGRIETRSIQLSQRVKGLRFPYAAQAFRVERHIERKGKETHEVVFGVTSLALDRAGEPEILAFLRGHWTIEAVHHIRDVTYDDYAALTIMPNRGAVICASLTAAGHNVVENAA